MLKAVVAILALISGSAAAQPVLWTGNFTNNGWTNGWAVQGAGSGKAVLGLNNVAYIADSSAPGGGFVRVTYPAGSYAPSATNVPLGGCQVYGAVLRTNGNTPRDAASLQFSVRFPTNFNFVLGGKLPGLYGGEGNNGTNYPNGTNGFSTRLMWRTNGAGEAFPFLPNSPTEFGTSLGRGNFFFASDGQWHTVQQDLVLNDPGLSNGYIRIWYDGVLAVDAPGLFFRSTNALKIDGVLFQTFFGGGDPTYATPVTTHADFAAFSISALAEISSPLLRSNYQAALVAKNPACYFKFDGSLSNSGTNASIPSLIRSGGGHHHDYFNNSNSAWYFSGTNDVLAMPSDVISGGGGIPSTAPPGTGSVTIVFRALDSTNSPSQSFLWSQGNTTANSNAFGLFFENATNPDPGALKLRVGNLTTTILTVNALLPRCWYFFAVTYNESRNMGEVLWYLGPLGRTLASGTININNDALVGDNGILYIGNNGGLNNAFRNPGVGRIDEFAIWARELSASEVSNQFNIPFASSLLTVSVPNNVVVSWPGDGRPWMALYSSEDLAANDWRFAGRPQRVGGWLVVTNSPSTRRFYRLKEQ